MSVVVVVLSASCAGHGVRSFLAKLFSLNNNFAVNLRICSCLACVYRVMDARGKFGEHERCVRVARGDSRVQL